MRRLVAISFLAVLTAGSAEARIRAVRSPGGFPAARSVMWIGAHPDDEAVAAPLLAKWCWQDDAQCSFVVLTRGERGPCLRPDGCAPDITSVRSAEAGSASALFHASSILLRYADGGALTPPPWAGSETLVAELAGLIETFHPEIILTFDPRHGTTCHPDHRETGRLVLEAAERVATPVHVMFLESRVSVSGNPTSVTFSPATPSASRFDANWDAIAEDMRRHASQFPEELITAVGNVRPSERAIYYAFAEDALALPVAPCP